MKVSKRVLEILDKYELNEEDKNEIDGLFNVIGDDFMSLKKGDVVKIVKSEYKGRLGKFVERNEEYGQMFILVEFELKGDMYKGKMKKKLFNVSSLEVV